MKYLFSILQITLCVLALSSCKMGDENGDLDGMWQLTEWNDRATNTSKATKTDQIFVSFQLKVMKFDRMNQKQYYLANFAHRNDSIIVGKTIEYPADTIVAMDTLTMGFAVPADRRFHIDELSSSHMQLSTASDILQFRKY
ncbi:MAG: lipocalin-like domain-containing protein [Bacteroidaceae bacterium]|nr:lipocalin-like domain-containing protein [Bacteroidaceae bacterium]